MKTSIQTPRKSEKTRDPLQPLPASDAANTADVQALEETHDLFLSLSASKAARTTEIRSFEETLDLFKPLPKSTGPHFTDDPEQTYLWSVGAMSKQVNEAVQNHLCRCAYCQAEVADMVESGAITLPAFQAETTVSNAKSPFHFGRVLRTILAVCAIGLFGLILGVSFFSNQSEQVAFDPKPVDRDWLIPDSRVEAPTKSVENRNEPGSKLEKFDDSPYCTLPESKRNTVAYHAAYGQYLLRHGRIAEAKEEFKEVNADSVEAALGFGLIAFAEEDFKTALDYFEKAGQRNDLSETLQFVVEYYAAKAARELAEKGLIEWDVARIHWKKALSWEQLKGEFASYFEEIEGELSIYE